MSERDIVIVFEVTNQQYLKTLNAPKHTINWLLAQNINHLPN